MDKSNRRRDSASVWDAVAFFCRYRQAAFPLHFRATTRVIMQRCALFRVPSGKKRKVAVNGLDVGGPDTSVKVKLGRLRIATRGDRGRNIQEGATCRISLQEGHSSRT